VDLLVLAGWDVVEFAVKTGGVDQLMYSRTASSASGRVRHGPCSSTSSV
jgi:hypothetical protein